MKDNNLEGQVGSHKEMKEKLEELEGFEEEKKEYYRPSITEKLSKQMILNVIGKDHRSQEFIRITDILGEPEISVDADIDRVDFTWNDYGVNIVIGYEEGIVENFFFYPMGINKGSCKQICLYEEFDMVLSIQEIIKRYGKPQKEKKNILGHELYYLFDNYKIYFTFHDDDNIYSILIGIKY
jgi:hypothetical protein